MMDPEKRKSTLRQLELSIRALAGSTTDWLYVERPDQKTRDAISRLFTSSPSDSDSSVNENQLYEDQLDKTPPQPVSTNQEKIENVEAVPSQQDIPLNPLDAESLDSLRIRLRDCARCRLWENRKTIVFGQGNIKADLVFIGEGPGGEEDKSGLAFVGRAGKLLTQIIQSVGVSRDSVFICNIVKCRPPGNRNPEPDEISACSPFIFKQLELLNPRLIITLGNVATKTLLPGALGIMKMRGKLTAFGEYPLIPTFHPSYLLRNKSALPLVWDDMRLARQVLFSSTDK